MTSFKSTVLAGALLFAAATVTTANAADYAPMPEEPVTEFGSNWYLRGDIGYKIYRDPDVNFRDRVVRVGNFQREALDNTGVIGGGVGYRFNNWFRGDVTVDYEMPSDFRAKARCPACLRGPRFSKEQAEIDAASILLNGYIDLGSWHGFTPYVGAGVGASNIRVRDYHFRNPNGVTGEWKGDTQWNLSYAAMAGVGYQISPNMVIDANYRYLWLGDGNTATLPIGTGQTTVRFQDIAAHEFRVGFRYMID